MITVIVCVCVCACVCVCVCVCVCIVCAQHEHYLNYCAHTEYTDKYGYLRISTDLLFDGSVDCLFTYRLMQNATEASNNT